MYKLNDFDYHLPSDLIAQSPPTNIGNSRLMLINRRTNAISHHQFRDLDNLIDDHFDLVINNTKVFPARLYGTKSTGGKVEVLLLNKLTSASFQVLTKPGINAGAKIKFRNNLEAVCIDLSDQTRTLEFNYKGSLLLKKLSSIGSLPLPPYIKSPIGNKYIERYQTVYARFGFSSASPTAGLHFSTNHLRKLKTRHHIHEITLNIGLGTFQPVKVEDIRDHHMHEEFYSIDAPTATSLTTSLTKGRKLLAVGTTSARTLESSISDNAFFPSNSSATNIFIYPPYRFKTTSALLTNFHLPRSTLLMMLCAFTSFPNSEDQFTTFKSSIIGRAYHEAIIHSYRFYSFGDAMLIL